MTSTRTRAWGIAGIGALVLLFALSWRWKASDPFSSSPRPLESAVETLKGDGARFGSRGGHCRVSRDGSSRTTPIPSWDGREGTWPGVACRPRQYAPPDGLCPGRAGCVLALARWPRCSGRGSCWACSHSLSPLWTLVVVALGLTPIALAWPPVATSLGQFTIVWLLGFAVGFRSGGTLPSSVESD